MEDTNSVRQVDWDSLRQHAQQIRQSVIRMLERAGSGHSAGALGMTDVFTLLYFWQLRHRPTEPNWPERDYVLLSNGHICPVWYATLAEAGYFPAEQLMTLRQLGSPLQGHPHAGKLPGIENTSGPLGQGLSLACGLASSLRLQGKPNHVYCLMSDGEHEEGQTWEAYLYGAKQRLDNLTVLIDRNHIQIDGTTEDVSQLEPLVDKIGSFGWTVLEVDGHSFEHVVMALNSAVADQQPSVIICNTTPGKGVSFMENDYRWHGKAPTAEEAARALEELSHE